ncbi:circularly permuted type 2 ATP-grasp protein [Pseudonocardia sp. GCM10023141]|uniref:circularly permuted type 2 ATP-grasp protein n=1 Tax=Pseudonocardia sp. GCM10023141 TaxID=3252653 RepID=UPI0036161CCA
MTSTADQIGLLAGYRPLPGVRDEMVDAHGRVREEWARVGHVLDGLGQRELGRRRAEAARLLADDGVSYQLSGGTDIVARWELDPLPVLLSSAQWAEIERGVIQRADLLNMILTDLYGPRQLLRRGLVPPELVFGHPGFLREADQIRIPGSQQLFTCAVDLARDADGTYWALSDRTQAPSGDGYALENRVVVSRVFPSMHRDAQVHRLAPFFRTLRSALQSAAPPRVDDPRIVVLTPGPWSSSAFEHAYLASSLGYPMVEGADLTVRDGRVWLRSLGRLEPVDVILRRVDSAYCDPLELRSDSLLGVPGLVEAARLGSVSVVNTLGSGVLENPGLLALLPRLSEQLLGQPLRLPSVPTWWCGEPDGRAHVLAHLDRLVIKSITREPGAETFVGWELSAGERDELRRRIEARPYGWVGQERLDLATVPTLTPDGLVPRRSVMRTFLVARNDSYVAMPGGLARVTAERDGAFIADSGGALSKDIWVVASEPEDLAGFWLQPSTPVTAPAASDEAMSSRAAENLFWMGRYAERAEAVVRLLRVVGDRRNDFPAAAGGVNPAGAATLRSLLAALTQITGTHPGFADGGTDVEAIDVGTELHALTTDAERPGTLAFAVRKLRDAAYPVRDQLSADTWLVMGALERELLEPAEPAGPAPGPLARVLTSLLALAGLAGEAMVRDQGWHFLDAGRRIERALQLCALLRATVTEAHDTATDSLLWESVLTTAESVITYRRRYRSHAQLSTLLDLLLLDADNPRSLAHQVDRLTADLAAVTERDGGDRLTEPERLLLECSTALRLADLLALTEGDGPARPDLAAFLDRMIDLLERAGDAIDAAHFTRLLPQYPLPAAPGPGETPYLRLV